MKVKDIISKKGNTVFTITEDKSLSDALRLLVNNNIGVLIVLNQFGTCSGIISERDVLRAIYKQGDLFRSKTVKDYMTSNVIVVEPEDELSYVESIMTENRIRHLPVFQNKSLSGLISIGDIVKAQLSDTVTENKYLFDYVIGNVR